MSESRERTTQSLAPVPAVNRTEAATTAIEELIIGRGLQPGDPLPSENQLCEQLQISRSAVREAMGQLQALDIVSVQRGRGTFVGGLSLRPIVRIPLLRACLGPLSTATLREVVEVRRILDIGAAGTIVASLRGTRDGKLQ